MSVWIEQKTKDIYKAEDLIERLALLNCGIAIIQGPSLCGKTALLHDLKHYDKRDIKIYSYAEMVDFIKLDSVNLNEITDTNGSIICIEDIDFLQGKEVTQKVVSSVVNTLSKSNLIILTGIQVLERNKLLVNSLKECQVFSFIGNVTTDSICDLHTHSTASDGTDSPEDLIRLAQALNLSAVALCDHNCVSGLERFINAAADKKVVAVPGIEITAGYNGHEIHMLGLFIKPCYFEKTKNYVAAIHQFKEKSNIELARRLNAAGIKVNYDEISNKADGSYVNRVDFAKAMVAAGYVDSVDEAFKRYLDKEDFGVPTQRLDAFEVIRFLKTVEALPVLAHPFINFTYEELLSFLPKAKECGLVGMETNYTTYTNEQTAAAIKLTERFGLLKSGGSDYHGSNKQGIYMGIGKGGLSVPSDYFEKLKAVLS